MARLDNTMVSLLLRLHVILIYVICAVGSQGPTSFKFRLHIPKNLPPPHPPHLCASKWHCKYVKLGQERESFCAFPFSMADTEQL